MLFIDASALTALIVAEPEADRLADRLAVDPNRCTSGVALWETALAVARIKRVEVEAGWSETERYRSALGAQIVPVAALEAVEAMHAHLRYGRGSGHPAKLNMGDCFAYACARTNNARLLYKGDDFAHTDLA